MPEMQYETEELRTGGARAQASSESAGQAQSALQGAPGGGSPYGDVNGADALHGAVGVAQQHHASNAELTSQNMQVAAQRAAGTAALGDDNTEETTALAPSSGAARAVSQGM